MSNYVKNFILCGDIEHYCLLCKELFQDIQKIERHIRWEKHRKNIKIQVPFPKFRKDFIYKVGDKFYCEICNFVSSTITAAAEHVKSDKHKFAKNNQQIEPKNFIGQYDSGYILIKKVILSMAQWNSVVDKKCLLCDVDVQSLDEHLSVEDHVIKLIQAETKYVDERYYRKINENKYHCFTCKKAFITQDFNDHWPNCENVDEIEIKTLKEVGPTRNTGNLTEDLTKMADLEKKLIKSFQEFYIIDERHNTATCSSTTVTINFKSMIMMEHVKNKHDSQETMKKLNLRAASEESSDVVSKGILDYGKRRSELAKYGKLHSIKLNFNGSKGWCLICDVYVSANKNNFKEHVRGAIHKGHLEYQGLKTSKKHFLNKSKSILQCSLEYSRENKVFWINNDYTIDIYSFFLLHQVPNDPHFRKTKCYACNELFLQGQELDHCMTQAHKNNFLGAEVIDVDVPLEFIREIRPNLYHCGLCNRILPFLEPLQNHMTTWNHVVLKEQKTYCCVTTEVISTKADVYTQLVQNVFGNK